MGGAGVTGDPSDTRAVVSDAEIAAGVVCIMCGVAGSGKTTWARALEGRGLVRLSIDEEIWRRFGRYGADYDADEYAAHQSVAQTHLDVELRALLDAREPVVLDYSFWRRADRERYRSLIEHHGRRRRLLVLRVEPVLLRRRLLVRQDTVDANGAFPVTDGLLDRYLAGFEWPKDEDETLLPA